MESVAQEKAAVELTPTLKQAYVDAIRILFKGVLTATPEQINSQVVADVDAMMVEIAKCSEAMSKLGFELIYEITLGKYVGSITGSVIRNIFIKSKVDQKIQGMIEDWVLKLSSDFRYRPCLEGARVNWKSKIEIDLLDI